MTVISHCMSQTCDSMVRMAYKTQTDKQQHYLFLEAAKQKHINNRLSNIKEMMKTSILLILMNT